MEHLPKVETDDVRGALDGQREQPCGPLAERLLSIAEDCAARLPEPFKSKHHGDLLYDQKGLPADK